MVPRTGVCGGDAVVDEYGVCEGSGIADGACDCDGTLPEDNFDCDGNCLVDTDCAGVCGGDAVVDECGVCEGSGICRWRWLFCIIQMLIVDSNSY